MELVALSAPVDGAPGERHAWEPSVIPSVDFSKGEIGPADPEGRVMRTFTVTDAVVLRVTSPVPWVLTAQFAGGAGCVELQVRDGLGRIRAFTPLTRGEQEVFVGLPGDGLVHLDFRLKTYWEDPPSRHVGQIGWHIRPVGVR